MFGSLLVLPTLQASAAAGATTTPAEAVRRSAANLPGLGPTDVFYPLQWRGTWDVQRQVVFPEGSSEGGEKSATIVLDYTFRFLQSVEDNNAVVVADRGFNQANLERSIARRKRAGSDETSVVILSYQWTETNPNDLSITFADGSRKDIKVTKRATERTDDTNVFSSEFQRVSLEDPARSGIPRILARRVLIKWKQNTPEELEALEIVYDLGGGDPLSGSSQLSAQPKVISKSRLLLRRPKS